MVKDDNISAVVQMPEVEDDVADGKGSKDKAKGVKATPMEVDV